MTRSVFKSGLKPTVLGSRPSCSAETDLDQTPPALSAAGVDHAGPEPGGGARLLQLADPDGNKIVFTGA